MTDSVRTPEPLKYVGHLPAGSAIILRHYEHPNRIDLALALKKLCDKYHIVFIVSGDPRLAKAVGADGLHLPEQLLKRPTNSVMSWLHRKNGLVTASVHSENLLKRAFNMGIDAIFVSPVFQTESHQGAKNIGVLRFSRISRYSKVPVYALGGITAATARRLHGCDVCGLAGIGNIIGNKHEND